MSQMGGTLSQCIYMHQIIMMSTLNTSQFCQLYVNKAEKIANKFKGIQNKMSIKKITARRGMTKANICTENWAQSFIH